VIVFPGGRLGVTFEICVFCGETPIDFGVEVYRKSTGSLVLGKSTAKQSRGTARDPWIAHCREPNVLDG
jgi:hypothetical protein